jgi:TolB-like protein/Flp pilus assembly protein TadD
MMDRVIRLYHELKRRRVFRVAVVYGAVAFVVAQAADIAFPALQLPPWTITLVVVLAVLGFPIALVLAWAFEVTPDGVVRTAVADAGLRGHKRADAHAAGDGHVDGDARIAVRGTATSWTGRRGHARWTSERVAAMGGVAVLALAGGAFMVFGGPLQRAGGDGGGGSGAPGGAGDVNAVGVGTGIPALAAASRLDHSVAVLPFEDLSPGGDHGWFSDGMTEDIQTQLSRIANLKVIGRTSVMRYKGTAKTAREIGEELAVATILEGSVRRMGDRVRVTAKLVHAATDEQMWAESFDRDLTPTDIFRIRSEIARQIAAALETRFSPEQRARLALAPTTSLTAYDLSLRGRYHAHRLTRDDLDQAIALYREALALDPGFAQAYAELAFAFAAMDGYHGAGRIWLDSAEVAGRRAIELDPAAADGYAALALAQWNAGRVREGIATYGQALAIRPNDPMALWGLSFAHWLLGDMEGALGLARRSLELDPASPHLATMLGRCLLSTGQLEAGERMLRYALELQPDFPWAHQDLLWFYAWTGRDEEGEEHWRIASELFPGSPQILNGGAVLALLRGDDLTAVGLVDRIVSRDPDWGEGTPLVLAGFAYHRMGAQARARQLWRQGVYRAAESLRRSNSNDHWARLNLARVDALNNDPDAAINWLRTAYDEGWRGYPMMDIGADPMLASLHGDPRFETIRAAMLEVVRR